MSSRRVISVAVAAAAMSAPLVALPGHALAAAAAVRTNGMWVADSTANSLTEYASGARGNAKPVATITGSDTGLAAPSAVAVGRHGKVFVTNAGNDSITEYAAGASGNVAPIAVIAGSKTGLDAPSSIAISQDQVWVTDPGDNVIEAFTSGSSGNELPAATYSGSRTKLNHPIAISVGEADAISVLNAPATGAPSVTAYFMFQTGDEPPFLVYRASKAQPLVRPTALMASGFGSAWVADAARNKLSELFLAPIGKGAVRRQISGSATGLNAPDSISHDAFGRLVVGNSGNNTVSVFSANARRNVAPLRTLTGVGSASGQPAAVTAFGTAPSAPTGLSAHRHGRKVRLSWDPPTATGGGLAGYDIDVERGSDGSGGFFGSIGAGSQIPVDTTNRTVTRTIKPGIRYSYRVIAVNAFGESAPTSPVHAAIPRKPGRPTSIDAFAHHTTMFVTWEPPARDGGLRHVVYLVQYAKCVPDTRGCTFKTKRSSRLPFVIIQGLKRHTTYHVRVVAKNRLGESKPSRQKSVKIKS